MSELFQPAKKTIDAVPATKVVNNEARTETPDENPSLMKIVLNAMQSRMNFFSKMFDTRRNLNDQCGYPETFQILPEHYYAMYEREPIAAKVVELMPRECFKNPPEIYEDEDAETRTEFEQAWDSLASVLRHEDGLEGYNQDQHPIWSYLLRLDILSGIGHYGVLLLGLDDGLDFEEPVKPKPGMKLIYLRPFDQTLAQIATYNNDVNSPRYGKPEFYNLTFSRPSEATGDIAPPNNTQRVHWSRVIHVADNLTNSDIFGIPRQRPVFNRLLDCRKLYGGSAEMYWKGAFPGLSLETHPQNVDIDLDVSSVQEEMTKYSEELQRFILTRGLTAKSLSPQVVDPTPQINTQITAICVQLDCPMRIFMGSERGQLASGQDAEYWDTKVQGRQIMHVGPKIISPFINRLIHIGVLPQPKQFKIEWEHEDKLTPIERAEIALKRVECYAKYVQGGVENIIELEDFLTREMGYDQDESQAIIEKSLEAQASEEDTKVSGSRMLELVGGITGMTTLFQQYHDGIIDRQSLKSTIMLFYQIDDKHAEDVIGDQPQSKEQPQPKPIFGNPKQLPNKQLLTQPKQQPDTQNINE